MPMLVDCALLSVARGCLWRRCRWCEDRVALPYRVTVCNSCLGHPARRWWSR